MIFPKWTTHVPLVLIKKQNITSTPESSHVSSKALQNKVVYFC